MKVAVAVSALAETDPASSSRKSDQGPVRSSIDGWPLASSLAEIAVRIDVPGHWTFVGVTVTGCGGGARENRPPADGCGLGLAMTVPPTSIFALAPAPLRIGGCTA